MTLIPQDQEPEIVGQHRIVEVDSEQSPPRRWYTCVACKRKRRPRWVFRIYSTCKAVQQQQTPQPVTQTVAA